MKRITCTDNWYMVTFLKTNGEATELRIAHRDAEYSQTYQIIELLTKSQKCYSIVFLTLTLLLTFKTCSTLKLTFKTCSILK